MAAAREKEENDQRDSEKQCEKMFEELRNTLIEKEKAKLDSLGLMKLILRENYIPYKSKNDDTRLKFVNLFNDYLRKFSLENVDKELIDKLSEDEVLSLYEYMNKTYEFIPLSE